MTVSINPMINCQNMTMITKIGFDFTSSFELVTFFIISVGPDNTLFHQIYIFLLIYNLPFL